MTPSQDYPRMMFHRTENPVIVQSRDEEDALGEGWSRTIWPAVQEPPAEPVPEAEKKSTRGRASGPHRRTSEAQNAHGQ